jgi:hypothetical protein
MEIDKSKESKPLPQMASAMDAYRERMGKLLDLTESQKKRVLEFLKNNIEGWLADTGVLHARLREDNDLVEGVVLDTGFPWPGASIVHVPVTETYMEVYHSILRRSILGGGIVWVTTTDDDTLFEYVDDVAEMMNDKAFNEWNVEEALDGVMWTTCRDGLGVIQVSWVEDYCPSTDIILIDGLEEFQAEFPTAEEAGVSAGEYAPLVDRAAAATPEEPLEVPVRFDKLEFYGNKCDIIELVDFITLPATAPDIRHEACRGYGKRFDERKATIRKKGEGKIPFYYPESVKKVMEYDGGSSTDKAEAMSAQDEAEGLGRSTKSQLKNYELTIKMALDEGGEEGKYLVVYNRDADVLLAMKEYPYRVDNCALFRINKRPNRLVGRSIPQKTRDINDEVDTMHRQRVNSRTITHVPSFILDTNKKKEFNEENPDPTFYPGKTFNVPGGVSGQAFDQMKVQPVDLGDSMGEEKNDMTILDLLLGSSVSLLSGQAAPGDPNAPGNKTATMIGQSNLRMDDPLSEFRYGVEQLGDICLSHLYQFGPPVLDYLSKTEGGQGAKTLYKKIFRSGLRMKMAGVTIAQNPETEMARGFQQFQFLMAWPVFQQNAQAQIEFMRDTMKKGRVQRWEKYIPTAEEMQGQRVEVQKQAMMQMEQEKALAARAQVEEELRGRITEARRNLEAKSLAAKTVEAVSTTNGKDHA